MFYNPLPVLGHLEAFVFIFLLFCPQLKVLCTSHTHKVDYQGVSFSLLVFCAKDSKARISKKRQRANTPTVSSHRSL